MTRFLLLTAAFCVAFSAAVASDIHRWTDDRFTVTPPPGFIAIPPELIVPENAAGRIVIYEGGLS